MQNIIAFKKKKKKSVNEKKTFPQSPKARGGDTGGINATAG